MTTEQARRGAFSSKAGMLIALCACVVLVISSSSDAAELLQDELLPRSLSSNSQQPSANVVSCTIPEARGSLSPPNSIVLSATKLSTTLQCEQGATAIPVQLSEVCHHPEQPSVEECKKNGTNLRELLQTSNNLEWVQSQPPIGGKGDERTLQLAVTDLPYRDTTFFVGCESNVKRSQACQVDITVKARSSSVDDKNVVTCAYGAESNPRALPVEMTEENNTLTIVCGKDGTIKPPTDERHYCEDKNLEKCGKSYKDILPRFDSSWWTKEGESRASVKLTIPRGDFPAEEQTFYVGCAPSSKEQSQKVSNASDAEEGDGQTSIEGLTTCVVQVTVNAASSTSSASPAVLTGSAFFGVAGVAGFAPLFSE
ncbi:SAG-related sequence [Besnoitia besnoiti]|uniref:SAG-related sequence n=1 Tax=Besnoitia besnoiti TaxID=94643 RepID=A0A2A9MIL5_BESBE|nr:SAG-related sequence [Besnoitia besnoiti]PFH37044.1 SAG-related sequence [Besnoitia besnoiti]